MEKVINNKRYFLYSSLSHELRIIYYAEIYKFLKRLVFEYQGFHEWYNGLFTNACDLKLNREIIICEDHLTLAGIAIIKNGCDEKKICTLRVAKEFQHQRIGHNLVELCFQQLNTEKPMITLHKSKLNQFEKILNYYSFELVQTQKHYYNIFNTELVFNGSLPDKKFMFNRIEVFDMERWYRRFMVVGKIDLDEYFDACIRCWYQKEQVRRFEMLEN